MRLSLSKTPTGSTMPRGQNPLFPPAHDPRRAELVWNAVFRHCYTKHLTHSATAHCELAVLTLVSHARQAGSV